MPGDPAESTSEKRGFLMSRQPIVAGERRLIGWKLLIANSDGLRLDPTAEQSEDYLAAALEFANSASWDSLLGGGRALLPVDRRLIFSDAIELDADFVRTRRREFRPHAGTGLSQRHQERACEFRRPDASFGGLARPRRVRRSG